MHQEAIGIEAVGRGVLALPSNSLESELIQLGGNTDTIHHLPVEQLTPSPLNPRKYFDKDYLAQLGASIRAFGLIQAITVRPAPDDGTGVKAGLYEIVAGECRWRASKLAHLPTIRCSVRELTDVQVLEIQIIENKDRKNLTALEESEGFWGLSKAGKTVPQIAAMLGGDKKRSAAYVYASMKLRDLIPECKAALLEKKILAGHAILIARLQPPEQRKILKEEIIEAWNGPPSVRELMETIQRQFHIDLAGAPWPLADNLLVETAGACTVCPKKIKVGKKEVCTDPACYKAKSDAFIVEREREIEADGEKCVRIWPGTYQVPKGILPSDKWRPASKIAGRECPGKETASAIVMNTGWAHDRNYKAGEVAKVCLDQKCPAHWSKDSPYAAGGCRASADDKARQKRHAALRVAREEAMQAILAKCRWPMPEATIRLLAQECAGRLIDHDQLRMACRIMGWVPKDAKLSTFSFRKAAEKGVAALQMDGIANWLTLCLGMPEVALPNWGAEKAEILGELARRAGVDLGAIQKKHLAEIGKKKPKAEPQRTPRAQGKTKNQKPPRASASSAVKGSKVQASAKKGDKP